MKPPPGRWRTMNRTFAVMRGRRVYGSPRPEGRYGHASLRSHGETRSPSTGFPQRALVRRSEHAADALAVERDLVDPEVEALRARLILVPAQPDVGERGQHVRVLLAAAVPLGGGGERRVLDPVPPEPGLVVLAVVQP